MADRKADAVDRAEQFGFDRRFSRKQFCQRRGCALAGIFLDEFFDEEKGCLPPLPPCGERVGVRGGVPPPPPPGGGGGGGGGGLSASAVRGEPPLPAALRASTSPCTRGEV